MGYYHGEQSLGLGPILITLSLVAVMGFGLMYYAFGRSTDSATTSTNSAAIAPAAIPAESTQPAVPPAQPTLATKTHNHV